MNREERKEESRDKKKEINQGSRSCKLFAASFLYASREERSRKRAGVFFFKKKW